MMGIGYPLLSGVPRKTKQSKNRIGDYGSVGVQVITKV